MKGLRHVFFMAKGLIGRTFPIERKLLPVFTLFLILFCASCSSAWDEILEEEEEGMEANLTVRTRASGETKLVYPIQIYAYDAGSGELVNEQTIESASDKLSMTLPDGDYHLVALAGMDDYVLTDKMNYDGQIQIGEKAPEEALIQGQAQVSVDGRQTTTEIIMSYQVACVDLILHEIPSEVTDVSVTLSPLHTALSLNGEYASDGNGKVTLTASPSGTTGIWKVPRVYLFGSEGDQTILTITLYEDDEKTVFGHTLKQPLQPGIPYSINGSYLGGFSLDGELLLEDWADVVSLRFDFGTSGPEDSDEEPEDDPDDDEHPSRPSLADIPEPGDIYDGFVVGAVVSEDGDEAELLLVSLSLWVDVASAYNEDHPDEASDYASDYIEQGIGGWTIPTKEEAKLLSEAFASMNDMDRCNQSLQELNGDSWIASTENDGNGKQVRYLCNESMTSYVIGSKGSQSKAGKTRTYFLRLVRRMSITIE